MSTTASKMTEKMALMTALITVLTKTATWENTPAMVTKTMVMTTMVRETMARITTVITTSTMTQERPSKTISQRKTRPTRPIVAQIPNYLEFT